MATKMIGEDAATLRAEFAIMKVLMDPSQLNAAANSDATILRDNGSQDLLAKILQPMQLDLLLDALDNPHAMSRFIASRHFTAMMEDLLVYQQKALAELPPKMEIRIEGQGEPPFASPTLDPAGQSAPCAFQQNSQPQARNRQGPAMHCDAAFPVAFVLLIGLICELRAVPFWLLLILAPLLFMVGLQVAVIRAGGLSPKDLPASRVMLYLVASLEVASAACFTYSMLPSLRGLWFGNLALATSLLTTPVLHYATARSDPGWVPLDEICQKETTREEHQGLQLLTQATAPQAACWTCVIRRPLRSKHCQVFSPCRWPPFGWPEYWCLHGLRALAWKVLFMVLQVCQRCVELFDHHCPVVCNCIGRGNSRVFVAYLLSAAVGEAAFVGLLVVQLWRSGLASHAKRTLQMAGKEAGLGLVDYASILWFGCHEHCGPALLGVAMVPITVGTWYLLLRATFCVSANLTTNELLNRARYCYLKDDGGLFSNMFDRGPAANCFRFWLGREEDWDLLLEDASEQPLTINLTRRFLMLAGVSAASGAGLSWED